jgi:hypothetical protein
MSYKVITTPKNKSVEYALDYDEAQPDQLIELVLNESDFNKLWASKVFDNINKVANSMIDNFEDERIYNEQALKDVVEMLYRQKNKYASDVNSLILEIIRIFEEAIKRGTGVYFYF